MTDASIIGGDRRYLGKATPKGLVIRAIGGGQPAKSYFIAVRRGDFTGPVKALPDFQPVTDQAEAQTVAFYARRVWNALPAGQLQQWGE